jgi:hypothetical protein
MADPLYPPAHPLQVGEVLDLAFRIFRVSLLKCLPLAIAALLSRQLPNIYSLTRGHSLTGLLAARHDGLWYLLYAVGWLLSTALWAAILVREHAIVSGAGGTAGTAGDAINVALRRLPGLIGIAVLLVVAIGAWFVPVGLAAGNKLAMLLVALLMTLPASFLALRFSCAYTGYLLNPWGAFEAVQRSWELTAGNFWRLAAIYTIATITLIVFYILAGILAAAIAAPFGFGDVALVTAISASLVVIIGSFATPFFTAVALAVFGDLLVRREGTDLAARISGPATS